MAHFEFQWGVKLWMGMWSSPGILTYIPLTVDKLTLVFQIISVWLLRVSKCAVQWSVVFYPPSQFRVYDKIGHGFWMSWWKSHGYGTCRMSFKVGLRQMYHCHRLVSGGYQLCFSPSSSTISTSSRVSMLETSWSSEGDCSKQLICLTRMLRFWLAPNKNVTTK